MRDTDLDMRYTSRTIREVDVVKYAVDRIASLELGALKEGQKLGMSKGRAESCIFFRVLNFKLDLTRQETD